MEDRGSRGEVQKEEEGVCLSKKEVELMQKKIINERKGLLASGWFLAFTALERLPAGLSVCV